MRKLLLALPAILFFLSCGTPYEAEFDATRPGAATRVPTYAGLDMQVEVKDVRPAPGGHRVTLLLRNPSVEPVNGARVSLRWPGGSRDVDLTGPLAPGVWQPVEVLLAPSSGADLAHLRLRMVLNTGPIKGRFGPY